MNQRIDRSRLLIGAYCLQPYAGSEAHVRDIAACHIDFMVSVGRHMEDTLDAFATYGVGAIVNGVVPGWWGGAGQNGNMAVLNPLDTYTLFILAIATSIDALAVGVTFATMAVSVLFASTIIGILTFFICLMGVYLGSWCGNLLGNKAEITGGLVLIGIGIKILIEHLFF